MSKLKITEEVLKAVESSPFGIASLEVLGSLQLCSFPTLKTTISRLNRAGRIIRVKRGVYSATPVRDPYALAQAIFGGYVGFSGALYLHKLNTEMPFTIIIVTPHLSKTRSFGEYEFRAVALGDRAVGFERLGNCNVSTRAKTLFDCLYLPHYSIEGQKLVEAFSQAKLERKEWKEFEYYVKKFAGKKAAVDMFEVKKLIQRS
ncbi:hypothetical protein COV61_03370 [Candidatus Micrarchaeota archaeon CG11_big_fil_rev_8_21_14_0_20_47_5]|nr:MAG: hypothetical protein AUJ17_02630 [Candidatus Micrarchaeota archaeon CG1_02_47_40]PIN83339.1 MAG: hypothetical protein COV61_03370 [Candidatus Micrarchaeota archaeon CG11_big_fil_rev_8_21_14_0_20_47_5]